MVMVKNQNRAAGGMVNAIPQNPWPNNERIFESAAIWLCAAAAVIAAISWPAVGGFSDGTLTLPTSAPRPSVPLVAGSVWSVTVQLWNWLEESWEELDWFDAEREFVSRVIDALSPYGGVYVEDAWGNDLDPDDLPHPNTPDRGVDCVISIDQDYYDTTRGFQWIRTRIETHVNEILEDL